MVHRFFPRYLGCCNGGRGRQAVISAVGGTVAGTAAAVEGDTVAAMECGVCGMCWMAARVEGEAACSFAGCDASRGAMRG